VWSATTLAPALSALEADVAAQLAPVRGIERSQLRADWHRLDSRYSPPRASRGESGRVRAERAGDGLCASVTPPDFVEQLLKQRSERDAPPIRKGRETSEHICADLQVELRLWYA